MPNVFQNNWTPKMMPMTNLALTNDFNNFQLNQMQMPQQGGYPQQQQGGYPQQQGGYPQQQGGYNNQQMMMEQTEMQMR